MSEYQMNITGKISLADYSSIYDYIAIVDKDDNLTISIENNAESINIVKQMLENNNFTVDLDCNKHNGRYYIKASKTN